MQDVVYFAVTRDKNEFKYRENKNKLQNEGMWG